MKLPKTATENRMKKLFQHLTSLGTLCVMQWAKTRTKLLKLKMRGNQVTVGTSTRRKQAKSPRLQRMMT